jgi:hypothetical protein
MDRLKPVEGLAKMETAELNVANYNDDFYQWTQQQADLLRQGQLSLLDVENIAEEIEGMGKSDRRAMENYLANIILHLLKWQYQPERRGSSWKLSIRNGRHHAAKRLKESPSLKNQVTGLIADEYPLVREYAAAQTGLPLETFPEQCPFMVEQIMGDYWPE